MKNGILSDFCRFFIKIGQDLMPPLALSTEKPQFDDLTKKNIQNGEFFL